MNYINLFWWSKNSSTLQINSN